MLSETVHVNQSEMGNYYKSIQMDDEDTLFFSKQQVSSDQQPLETPKQHTLPPSQLIIKLLQFFFGRSLFISKVLKQESERNSKYLKEKIILIICGVVIFILLLIALYFGFGHFLIVVILLGCVCLYFNEMRQEKLRYVLSNCGEITDSWAIAYRKLMKYIKQIQTVYAQINLNNDNDFRQLFSPLKEQPIEKKFMRPRIACLEIRRLLIKQILKIQNVMIQFIQQAAQRHADLKPKSNLPELIKHQPHPNDYYTLNDIKTLHSTLLLLKYDVKQVCTYLILNPNIPSFVAYQIVQEWKAMKEGEMESARAMMAMLESYQSYTERKEVGNKIENPKREIVRYCKERTHLLNVYYNEFMETGEDRLVGLAMTEMKGISLCLTGLIESKRIKQKKEQQPVLELGDNENQQNTEQNKVADNRVYYLNENGERVNIESADSQQVIQALEALLRNNQKGKIKKEVKKEPDERIKFGFLGELKNMFGQNNQHVFE